MIGMKSIILEVMKPVVSMKLHTNGNEQVGSVYYAGWEYLAVENNNSGIIGHFNIIKQLF